ncbi:hypothetical protein AGABI1DRAFT_42980 [Agaricus bisporus var. burnettii JB137-S8]|uniref:Hydrophobin n=2 Tax=Agaricus bisporus var. burnettii TaxID=192524 RepID=K5X3P6_AGABU|nr:uncharacterized protein AGABI1DRAFT_42980 [Agaricus bisporus var. burnettii JB137-S8]EKM77793.1 hypothetical protein AGABI1DRAFT_42980 [Agaricus bisporus var. burnettii JB137-S8]KAF7760143.1 fungal hydrophobin [Agaricus bisporus var. burnettii]
MVSTFITVAKTLLVALLFVNINIVVGTATTGKHCSTGPIECCKQVMDSKSPQVTELLTKNGLGLGVLAGVKGLVGANCSPITAIGIGSGSQCSGQTVCCQNNNFNGVVAIGCTPINANV